MLARRAISLMTKLARPTRIVRYQSTVVTRPQQMTVSRATTTLSNSNKTKLSYSPIVSQLQCRSFAANLLQQPEVADRVLKVVKDFHRVGESVAVSDQSHFIQDLGLDSLDEVELVLAIEDEFAIEIPDADAEKIHSVTDAVKYILTHPHAK